jgi:hypothetical protein
MILGLENFFGVHCENPLDLAMVAPVLDDSPGSPRGGGGLTQRKSTESSLRSAQH